jgi:hypothetical protein
MTIGSPNDGKCRKENRKIMDIEARVALRRRKSK